MFHVKTSRKADKFHRLLDDKTQQRILELLETLENSPVPVEKFDVTKLTNSQAGYRIRIGDFRVIYTVFWNQHIIEINEIERKKNRTYK